MTTPTQSSLFISVVNKMGMSEVQVRKKIKESQKSQTVMKQRMHKTTVNKILKKMTVVKILMRKTTMVTAMRKTMMMRATMAETKKTKKTLVMKSNTNGRVKKRRGTTMTTMMLTKMSGIRGSPFSKKWFGSKRSSERRI